MNLTNIVRCIGCYHLSVEDGDDEVRLCVRGTSHLPYVEAVVEALGERLFSLTGTVSVQRYGTPMTVRPATKCTHRWLQ